MTEAAFEVLTTGRIGVDLYPLQSGVSLVEVETFGKFLGGSATNVAVAAARHGRRAAVISRTGADRFGEYIHRALQDLGVDDRWVTAVPDLLTPVTFCELFPPDNFPIHFYRKPKAPDLQIRTEELDLDAIAAAHVFWVTVTGLSEEPSRAAELAALEARRPGFGFTVLDLDYRPAFWPTEAEAARWASEALGHATVAVGNREECRVVTGASDANDAADALLGAGVELAIVKQGPAGVLAATRDRRLTVPPIEVTVVNGLGAGDAFGGALCHGLLGGWDLARTISFANAAGAIVASRLACAQAMPASEEVEQLLELERETDG